MLRLRTAAAHMPYRWYSAVLPYSAYLRQLHDLQHGLDAVYSAELQHLLRGAWGGNQKMYASTAPQAKRLHVRCQNKARHAQLVTAGAWSNAHPR